MPKLSLKQSERESQVDELGALEAKFARLKPDADRMVYLRGLIASWYPDLPAAESTTAEGAGYFATVSAKANKREVIDIGGLFKRLTSKVFFVHAKLPLGVLDELLTVEELPKFIKSDRTGARTIKTYPMAP